MKLNTNSNVYTIVYATILVVIVAVLLAVVSQSLRSRQQANRLLDEQKQILVALNQDYSQAAALYNSLVRDTLLKDDKNNACIIRFELDGQTKYVLRLHGQGLWGGIGGYMALDADKNTVYGINFNHESETPGLGGEIVTEKFRSQFFGKHIKDNQGVIRSIAVLKEGKTADAGQEQVDAWAGATITSTGVNDMLAQNLQEYSAFLSCKAEACCSKEVSCPEKAQAACCGACTDCACCKEGTCCKDGVCCQQGTGCPNCTCQDKGACCQGGQCCHSDKAGCPMQETKCETLNAEEK